MTCPTFRDWALLSMGLLEPADAESLLEHARVCAACRESRSEARRQHADLIRMYEAFDRDHDELREQLLAALPAAWPQPTPIGSTRHGLRWLGGLTMSFTNRTTLRTAALLVPAACILIAVVVFLVPGSSSVAFAQVLERMRQARTMVCDVNLTMRIEFDETFAEQIEQDGEPAPTETEHTTRGKLSMYSDGTTRAWLLEQTDPPMRQLTLPDRLIVTENGRHSVTKLTDDPDTPGYLESPEVWLQRLLALAEEPDHKLGESMIAGRKVVGFEILAARMDMGVGPLTDDPASIVRLWVVVETGLPVRLEFDVARKLGPMIWRMQGAWDRMEWDVPLDPQMFAAPAITEADEVKNLALAPAIEETLLAGLRVYAEQSAQIAEWFAAAEKAVKDSSDEPEMVAKAELLANLRKWAGADRGYPAQLDLQSIGMDISMRASVLRARLLAERARRAAVATEEEEQKRRSAEDEQQARENDRIFRAVGGAAMFYRKLVVEGREPEYFGKDVQPGDGSAVLLRWKIDDAHMRVIYGDLRAATVPGAE